MNKVTKRLTKKQLINHLIKVYSEALVKGSKMNHKTFISFLNNKYLGRGICLYMNVSGLKYYGNTNWIQKYSVVTTAFSFESAVYWAPCPDETTTKSQAVESLKVRINNLEKELKNCR